VGRDSANTATYTNYTLQMALPLKASKTRLIATPGNYRQQLCSREDIPHTLRAVIAELFDRRAIIYCSLAYGCRLELRLPQGGKLVGGALTQFLETFQDITGETIDVTWEGSGEISRSGSGDRDYSGIGGAFAEVIDFSLSALSLAADIKILFGGNND
jgi:hypothetical protein